MKKNKNWLCVVICLIAYMWLSVRAALMCAMVFIGINEIVNAIELHKNRKKRPAIFSLCIGMVLCGFVVIEAIEKIVDSF